MHITTHKLSDFRKSFTNAKNGVTVQLSNMAWNIIVNLPSKGGKNSLCLFAFAIQLGPGNCQRRLRQGVSCGISHFSNSDASTEAMSYLTDKTG